MLRIRSDDGSVSFSELRQQVITNTCTPEVAAKLADNELMEFALALPPSR